MEAKEQPKPKLPPINQQVLDILQVADRLSRTKWNVVVFRDTPWLYAQYYLGLTLNVKTILIIRKQDKYFAKRLKHPMLKHIIVISNYGDENAKEVTETINKIVKSYEAKEK